MKLNVTVKSDLMPPTKPGFMNQSKLTLLIPGAISGIKPWPAAPLALPGLSR